MFLVPIPQGESFTTLLNFLKSWIKGLFGGSLSYIIVVILIVSAIMSTYDYFAKPEWIRKNHYLTRAFTTTPLYLVSKIIGAVFAVIAFVCLTLLGRNLVKEHAEKSVGAKKGTAQVRKPQAE